MESLSVKYWDLSKDVLKALLMELPRDTVKEQSWVHWLESQMELLWADWLEKPSERPRGSQSDRWTAQLWESMSGLQWA
jgi:hypothetical protein